METEFKCKFFVNGRCTSFMHLLKMETNECEHAENQRACDLAIGGGN